jgi:glucose/arabinose dehydrogenase
MLRALTAAVLALLLAAVPAGAATPSQVALEPVASGLGFPAAFTVFPDGRILYAERLTGQLRVVDPATSSDTLYATIPDLTTDGEQGVLGVAVDPGYPSRPQVYAVATRLVAGTATMQLLRITETAGVGGDQQPIFQTPAAHQHNGGRVLFGPGARLFLAIGDHGQPTTAQDATADWGKVLRMTRSGRAPADNPLPGSRVYATGIRNSFGMARDPFTGTIWETENGPECNDELNALMAGANYGWGPTETCLTPPEPPANTNQDGADPVLPALWWSTTIAPTGAAFCRSCGLGPGSRGLLYMADFNDGQLHAIELTGDRAGAAGETVVFAAASRKLLAVERAPDGTLYASGTTAGGSGWIARIVRS